MSFGGHARSSQSGIHFLVTWIPAFAGMTAFVKIDTLSMITNREE